MVDARFVGGTGRCGTAILGSILASHPAVTYFREPRFLSDGEGLCDYVRGTVGLETFKHRMVRRWRKNLVEKLATVEGDAVKSVYTPALIHEILDREMDGQDRIRDGRRFVAALLGVMGRPYWVEKTPHTVMHVDVLYQMFPEMRYVHLIRDPRDLYASLQRCSWGPKTIMAFVDWYNMIMLRAQIAHDYVLPRCYLTVEMEDMVQSPSATLARILEFLEIPYSMVWFDRAVSLIDVDRAHVGRYRDEIPAPDAAMIARECGAMYDYWREKCDGHA